MFSEKWDLRYLQMAKTVASWSKDPSTKTGAVFVRPDNTIISLGYNGFARGVNDNEERYNNRDIKYEMIIHCEENALIAARGSVVGACLYTWPFISCSRCAAKMIQAGIARHVGPTPSEDILTRWGKAIELSLLQFKEAGVEVIQYPIES